MYAVLFLSNSNPYQLIGGDVYMITFRVSVINVLSIIIYTAEGERYRQTIIEMIAQKLYCIASVGVCFATFLIPAIGFIFLVKVFTAGNSWKLFETVVNVVIGISDIAVSTVLESILIFHAEKTENMHFWLWSIIRFVDNGRALGNITVDFTNSEIS